VHEVLARHAEAAGGDLLDGAAALGVVEPLGVLAALAGVAAPAERFIAMASVSCASGLIEPSDMAPVLKRFTISLTGSTSSTGTGVRSLRKWNSPRSVPAWPTARRRRRCTA
jgi:hypothetical protein